MDENSEKRTKEGVESQVVKNIQPKTSSEDPVVKLNELIGSESGQSYKVVELSLFVELEDLEVGGTVEQYD